LLTVEWFAFIVHREYAAYILIMLMTAGAAIIAFCVMFALLMPKWNDSRSGNVAPARAFRAESESTSLRLCIGNRPSAVIEGEGRENQLWERMLHPPKFRRCYGVSEKFSEVSEKSALRRHLCSPFVTDVFFAHETSGRKFFSRLSRYKVRERRCDIADHRFEFGRSSK
jgi:hypothetical protein